MLTKVAYPKYLLQKVAMNIGDVVAKRASS
jgi:hypothetical protein